MFEASKALMRRLHDSRFSTRYFVGRGIDIGAGPDALTQYAELFPLMKSCLAWDVENGDAQHLKSLADESLDFAHSSHCLEHMRDPREALTNWLRVVKPGGYLVVIVPDEDMYEQGVFPSTFNTDHKWTFTLHKMKSWSDKSVNLISLLADFSDRSQICKIEQLDATFRFGLERFDQTLTPVGESAIEFVLRKSTPDEIVRGGRLPGKQQKKKKG
jgi:SAM-dependent methyltransferase